MIPIVRRYSDGLLVHQNSLEAGQPPAVFDLSWDEAESLMIQLRHECQERDIRDGVAAHAPAGVTCWCDKVHEPSDEELIAAAAMVAMVKK